MPTPDHIHPAVLRTFVHPPHDFINHPEYSTACAVCGGVSHPFGPGGFDPGPAPTAAELMAAQDTLEAYDGREEDIPEAAMPYEDDTIECPDCGLGPRACACDDEDIPAYPWLAVHAKTHEELCALTRFIDTHPEFGCWVAAPEKDAR